MSKSKRIVGDFESKFGVFKPGDKAYAVTRCTGRMTIAEVEYVGYIERIVYDWRIASYSTEKFAQIRRPSKKTEWYNKETGEVCEYFNGAAVRWVDCEIITTLQLNNLIPLVK